ncbi:MAG: amidohydrolase [Hymenobacteraceae bacterium]|nr:amidohydrolase [Hymenobacteraceae bacterium]
MLQSQIPDLPAIIKLRQHLHQNPELSGSEYNTAAHIARFLQQYAPDELHTGVGGTGIAAVFKGTDAQGPTILFRAELDALPIAETNDTTYRSVAAGIGHKCGHDGHMAILAGLASLLHRTRPASGRVVLLFQPAEETGAGAWAMLQDKRLLRLQPDYVFALHNLPGLPQHQVVVRNGVFAAASTGMVVELHGKSSHAAEPENGVNPGAAMAELVLAFNQIAQQKERFEDLSLLTVIHARLGEVAFGTNPGYATVMATLRAYLPEDFALLKHLAQEAATHVAAKYDLRVNLHFAEEFPATLNHPEAVALVRQAAQKLQLPTQEAVHPFRWSEDFGHFTARYKGALFGIGAGLEQPQLHHADYDFPDAIIPTGAALFYGIAQEIMNP